VSPEFVHRELLLPSPTEDPPAIAPLVWSTSSPFALEIHRETAGQVRYALGSPNSSELNAMLSYLEGTRARLTPGRAVECLAAIAEPDALYARAIPVSKHHHLPLELRPRQDQATFLLRLLGSLDCQKHDVVVQLLFRGVGGWESTFTTAPFQTVAA